MPPRGEEVVGVMRSRREEEVVVVAAAAVCTVVKSALAHAMNEGIEQPQPAMLAYEVAPN